MDFRNTGRIRNLLHSISTALMRDQDVVVMRTSGPSPVTVDATSDRTIMDAAIGRVSPVGLQPRAVTDELTDPTGELDVRLATTFSAASMLLEAVPKTQDRRRAMLYISNGYESERGRALASLFSHAAQQVHVTVFAINAAALAGSAPVADVRVDPTFWTQVLESRRQTLQAIAEPTGGIAFLEDVDLIASMSRIRAAVPGR